MARGAGGKLPAASLTPTARGNAPPTRWSNHAFEALSGNPGRGSGAKQTHEAEGGVRRRREKRQDGQATGNGKPVVTTQSARVAKRDHATPWEELGARSYRVAHGAGKARLYSEEE